MSESRHQDFVRYLDAKTTVDDRAIDRRVWDRLGEELSLFEAGSGAGSGAGPVRVAEIGAGTGTGLARMLARGLFAGDVRYLGVDVEAAAIERARVRHGDVRPGVDAGFVVADLDGFAADADNQGRFDLVVTQAFLDLFDPDDSLPALLRLLRPGGLLYAPITFDGETLFEPGHDADDPVLAHYHASMDADRAGHSKTGRRLFHALQPYPAEVLEVASSDWVVYPRAGGYPGDEAYFLQFIIATIERAVLGRPGSDADRVRAWAAARYQQIERAELVYIAHQLDYLVRKKGA